jgi:hypothetical protein
MVLQSAGDYAFMESAINPVSKHRNPVLKGEKNLKPARGKRNNPL